MKAKIKKLSGFKGIKNIGSTINKRLSEIGVNTLEDLQKIGAAQAYLKIKSHYPDKTLPVCYYLYSLEGALTNLHWDDIPETRKQILLKAIGK
jgi:DNA transformation protein and related proteins